MSDLEVSGWSDPRFAVEKSQKLDKIFMQSLPSISSKTKVKFNDVIETIEMEEPESNLLDTEAGDFSEKLLNQLSAPSQNSRH